MILWQLNLPENPPTAADAHCRMQTAIFKTKMGGMGWGWWWWVVGGAFNGKENLPDVN